jgi:acetoin utilization deacetylase AcuC-like enzyme
MRTGVFFHEVFKGRKWLVIGDKFGNFPAAMAHALALPGVDLFTPDKVSEALLNRIHTPRMVRDLSDAWYGEAARYAVGGCVEAVEKVLAGELENALAFTVAAGHHAESDHAWGGTYVSCAGPALLNARDKLGPRKIAILDTDRHHGNGTREIFRDDPDVLHVCFCSWDRIEGDGNKVCVNTAVPQTDQSYMKRVRAEFMPRARAFQPHLIFHNLGHDTCELDYGDLGLSPPFFPRLVKEIRDCARELCEGRYVVLTHGGKRADVADYIFPRIIEVLAER